MTYTPFAAVANFKAGLEQRGRLPGGSQHSYWYPEDEEARCGCGATEQPGSEFSVPSPPAKLCLANGYAIGDGLEQEQCWGNRRQLEKEAQATTTDLRSFQTRVELPGCPYQSRYLLSASFEFRYFS